MRARISIFCTSSDLHIFALTPCPRSCNMWLHQTDNILTNETDPMASILYFFLFAFVLMLFAPITNEVSREFLGTAHDTVAYGMFIGSGTIITIGYFVLLYMAFV